MAESEPAHQNDEKCQQLRYFQMRGEKWLLKLKLIILAVLCVLLGVFLLIYKVQAHLQDTQKHEEALKLSENEDRIKQLEAQKSPGDPKSYCARGWKYFSGKCYYFSTDEKTWTASRDACVAEGGHLVIISSPEEQDFLKRSKPKRKYWIGLTDAVTEGDWRWLDGTRLSKTSELWTGNEPDNWTGKKREHPEGEDCTYITVNTGYYDLLDAFCDSEKKNLKRICEAKAPI